MTVQNIKVYGIKEWNSGWGRSSGRNRADRIIEKRTRRSARTEIASALASMESAA